MKTNIIILFMLVLFSCNVGITENEQKERNKIRDLETKYDSLSVVVNELKREVITDNNEIFYLIKKTAELEERIKKLENPK